MKKKQDNNVLDEIWIHVIDCLPDEKRKLVFEYIKNKYMSE